MRIGGAEMVIKNIIEGCDNARFEMSIYCIEEPLGPWGQDLQQRGISVATTARKDGFDTKLIKAIRQHISTNHIDILHCHQYTPWVYGTLAAIGLKTKVVFTEHGRFYPDSSSWKRRIVNPVLAAFTYKITAISKATKKALLDYEFLKENAVEVIYNGIKPLHADTAAIEKIKQTLGLNNDDFIFGTIARLDPVKNHEMMLNAFAKVVSKQSKVKLIIVGDGELMQSLQAQVLELGLKDNVILTGYISYPKDYLALFDIFLLSSLSEGTSMTLLEAMSLGKPCIVTDAGGNKEIVGHEETGLVVDNNNMTQFADAMLLLSFNESKNLIYGKNAEKCFDEKFDEQHMSAEYNQCYGA